MLSQDHCLISLKSIDKWAEEMKVILTMFIFFLKIVFLLIFFWWGVHWHFYDVFLKINFQLYPEVDFSDDMKAAIYDRLMKLKLQWCTTNILINFIYLVHTLLFYFSSFILLSEKTPHFLLLRSEINLFYLLNDSKFH